MESANMENAKLIVSIVAALVAAASFIISRRADARSKKAEAIKSMLGEKESVAFAALKLLRDGLPANLADRKLLISALMQACVFESSSRARALLYRVIENNRAAYGNEFEEELKTIKEIFDSMDSYKFPKEEFDLGHGRKRISAVERVIVVKTHA
jgi:hypothetical protein